MKRLKQKLSIILLIVLVPILPMFLGGFGFLEDTENKVSVNSLEVVGSAEVVVVENAVPAVDIFNVEASGICGGGLNTTDLFIKPADCFSITLETPQVLPEIVVSVAPVNAIADIVVEKNIVKFSESYAEPIAKGNVVEGVFPVIEQLNSNKQSFMALMFVLGLIACASVVKKKFVLLSDLQVWRC